MLATTPLTRPRDPRRPAPPDAFPHARAAPQESGASAWAAVARCFADPTSLALAARARRIAQTDAHALLLGERGTGKASIARQIHADSARRDHGFWSVNCGACPVEQLESELFGFEKGAFPGAFAATPGRLESTHHGTAFVDEVDRLPPALQLKLLALMRDRVLTRIGAQHRLPADVRVVAASSVNLEAAVRAGRFHEELYYVLRPAHLTVPALRERRGDILPLARHFLHYYRERLGYAATRFSDEAEARLLAHSWPGNLRELENVVHHALVYSGDSVIEAAALSLTTLTPQAGSEVPQAGAALADALAALKAALEELAPLAAGELDAMVERSLVQVAYRHSRFNQVKAARLLGLSRNVLRARLIAHGEIKALK